MNIFEIFLIKPLANGLIVFYKILGNNLGLAIIGFSVFLKLILIPLTRPYFESIKKMKELSPQLEKLKKKHASDRIKLAQAQSEFYRQKGINPASGCLPYLLQFVVLIAFFNVFARTLSLDGDLSQKFNTLLYEPLKFSQGEEINTHFLYLDITKPDVLNIGLPFLIPGPTVVLSAIIQFISAKVMAPATTIQEKVVKKTKEVTDDFQLAMQKSMIYTFPFFTLIIGMSFASGLVLYWLVFSFIQMLQQVRSQGWGELTPLINRFKLIKS